MKRQRVLVAMSGGVDSAVAAGLLVEAGHEVLGVTMHLWDYGDAAEAAGSGRCCGPADVRDARRAAATLGIRHYVLDFKASFQDSVVAPFLAEYRVGRTPIPCVACNRKLKFDVLVARAAEVGADLVATGHYARARPGRDGRPRLLRARDRRKDQSYFLFSVTAAQLARARFPVGELTKDAVRAEARRLGLGLAEKPESQEICFIPDGDTAAFVTRALGASAPGAGEIVDAAGRVLGAHAGIHRYTVGQRRGLGLAAGPWYVLRLDAGSNRVVVGSAGDLERVTFKVAGVNWIGGRPPRAARVTVKIRHAHPEAQGTVRFLAADAAEVTLAAPARAVAPGQAAVFYRGDLVLGGGWIA